MFVGATIRDHVNLMAKIAQVSGEVG